MSKQLCQESLSRPCQSQKWPAEMEAGCSWVSASGVLPTRFMPQVVPIAHTDALVYLFSVRVSDKQSWGGPYIKSLWPLGKCCALNWA